MLALGAGAMAVLGVVLPEMLLSSVEQGTDEALQGELRRSASQALPSVVLRQTLAIAAPLMAILTARACAAEFETGSWAWTATLREVGATVRMKLLAGVIRGVVLVGAGAVAIAIASVLDGTGIVMGPGSASAGAAIAVVIVLAAWVTIGGVIGVLARRTTAAVAATAFLLLLIEPAVRSSVPPAGPWVLLPSAAARSLVEGLEGGTWRLLPLVLLALPAGLFWETTVWRARNCDRFPSST
jgi:hypothetical protein